MPDDTIYAIPVRTISGEETTLDRYKGKMMLIVNVASECGFTPQYAGLEGLYEKFHGKGLVVLGFPCNQFGSQEPGTEQQIKSFCETRFKVKFPLFSKIDVNGPNAHALFKHLKRAQPGTLGIEAIKWNFTKFLVGRDGTVIKRYRPQEEPESMEQEIAKFL